MCSTKARATGLLAALALVTAAASLATPTASAHKLPGSIAKTKAATATKRFWRSERYSLLDRVEVSKCRRLSPHKIRCKTSVHLQDDYGCERGSALVSVTTSAFGLQTKVARDTFHPFYDPASTGYDAMSCTAYGF